MTLRRCDSLPARLRENAVLTDDNKEGHRQLRTENGLPGSKTVPNFQETPTREQVIATWKSLQSDVKNIKNGFPTTNDATNHIGNKKDYDVPDFTSTKKVVLNDKDVWKKNRRVGINSRDADRSCSYPLDREQNASVAVFAARRKTLLQRLLSWRTRECNCREHYRPRPRPEDLLCTCGTSNVNRVAEKDKCIKFTERGRSKSVGYETAREVTQFRRLVQCVT